MATRRHAPQTSPPEPTAWSSTALRFFLDTGRLGESVSQGMARHVGDGEILTNLTVKVIADLAVHGARRPVDIQATTGFSSGGVTKLVDRLEGLGLVQRSHGLVPSDRRAIMLTLTAAGHELAEQLARGLVDGIDDTRRTLRELADEADAVAAAALSGGDGPARDPQVPR